MQNLYLHGTDFYKYISQETKKNPELCEEWLHMFTGEASVISTLYVEIIDKYIRMSSAQFRHEYMRKLRIEKEEAHRKQVKIKTKKSTSAQGKLTMKEIKSDETDNKISSHLRLQSGAYSKQLCPCR